MDAKQINLLKFMQADHQLYIPIFQRKYSWNISQCNQLFNDILTVGRLNDNTTHFIGSVVYMRNNSDFADVITQRMIIDGQQRLTTVTILISALALYLKEHPLGEDKLNYTDLLVYYLTNSHAHGENKYKLILTNKDKDTIIKIIDNISSSDVLTFNLNDSKKIKDNFTFFRNNITKDNVRIILNGLKRLNIIQISLEPYRDNPQLIYESLNSTGLELTKSDLIRNYVLMSFPPEEQDEIYNKYWISMEKGFEGTQLFDKFIRDYLTIKTKHIPGMSNVYNEFKSYNYEQDNMLNILKDLNNYSKYYFAVAFGKDEEPEIRDAFKKFNQLKAQVSYPFLMEVYKDYTELKITKNDLINVIKLIESYIFRRLICELPTSSLSKTFASLYKSLNPEDIVTSLEAQLLLMDAGKRFPENSEVKTNFKKRDLYHSKNILYLLSNLESYKHPKNYLNFSNYTIEHIMPQNQNISDEWKESLGENYEAIHEKYIHTIGNLTLTAYNSSLSDSSFKHKQNMENGFKDSPLFLNHYIAQVDDWNEEEIKQRAETLSNLALEIWPYPKVNEETLKKYSKKNKEDNKLTLDNYPRLEFSRNLFNTLNKEILSLGEDVKLNLTKSYISYKIIGNFVYIKPQSDSSLLVHLIKPFDTIEDPKKIGKDITKFNLVGNSTFSFRIYSLNDIDYAMSLIKQSYDYMLNK